MQSLSNWFYFILFTQEQTHDIKQDDSAFTTKDEKETVEKKVEKGDEETKTSITSDAVVVQEDEYDHKKEASL